jgi:predicted GNAT family N-acyltransferase
VVSTNGIMTNVVTEQDECAFALREITGSPLVQDTFRLRYEVWRGETELMPAVHQMGLITDEHDCHARHWAAFRDDRMIASARLCLHGQQTDAPEDFGRIKLPCPIATMCRLVVHRSARKCGLAHRLDMVRIEGARESKSNCVVVSDAQSRIPGLLNLGFQLTDLIHTASYRLLCLE